MSIFLFLSVFLADKCVFQVMSINKSMSRNKKLLSLVKLVKLFVLHSKMLPFKKFSQRPPHPPPAKHLHSPLATPLNLHLPLPKIRTIGDEFTFSLAKNSQFSFLPSHFPSLPSRIGQHCGDEIREFMSSWSHFALPKHFALFVPTLPNGASRATSDRKPKKNDQIFAP